MREYRTILVSEKRDVDGKMIYLKSDWELIEVYDENGVLLLSGLTQNVPTAYGETGFFSDRNSCRPLAPIGGDRRFNVHAQDAFLLGMQVIPNVDTPGFDEIGDISGYFKD